LGALTLQVNNVYDKKFSYQDDSFREFSPEPSVGPYYPERLILARFSLSF
jgi:hypothetical protein